jgi:putative hydrolase of the HAD superfamily
LFDAGDILYYRPNNGKRLGPFLAGLGLDPAGTASAAREQLKEQAFLGLMPQDEYYRKLILLYGVSGEEDIENGMRVLEAEDQDVHMIGGVSETLRALKNRGFLLGIVTDTAHPVHAKLNWFEQGGFGDVWDSIISSNELGVRKPDPRIYQAALQQLGVGAEEAVFVGHKASELSGAQAAGIATIAFNQEPAAQADFFIGEFKDLLTLPALSLQKKE